MTKADQKIINDNKGLQPYELLAIGLSDEGYNELVAKEAKATKSTKGAPAAQAPETDEPEVVDVALNYMEPAIPPVPVVYPAPAEEVVVPVGGMRRPAAAAPVITDYRQPLKSGDARVRNPSNGNTFTMNRIDAEKMQRRYPDNFQILD